MSGTSLDGVDVALVETDGFSQIKPIAFESYPYDNDLKKIVKAGFGKPDIDPEAEKIITDAHIKAVKDFGQEAEVIGFHGQTILHDPNNGKTVQIGDAARLAKETGIDVVYDFRSADVAAGGQGAPLIPLYHWGLVLGAKNIPLPAVVINIGGVANITWINHDDVIAFDCGPGNALINDFMVKRKKKFFDEDGKLAAAGAVDRSVLDLYLEDAFFEKAPPKSLDRDHWNIGHVMDLSDEYGAATLTALTAEGIAQGYRQLPERPKSQFVAGGGRHNKEMMERLGKLIGPVKSVDDVGWDGDALEAQGFAYLAVRSLAGAPISLPKTTGVPKPMTGGLLVKAS